jgi:molybdenum cofactor cytidylyltransferase
MLAAVILSGGASRRMGSPKALLPYQGQTFLEHLLQITVHEKIGVRRVVLGADVESITNAIKLRPDEIVINEDWKHGQLRSIQAALQNLPPDTEGMLLCLVDHPFVSANLVNTLIARFYSSKQLIVLPAYKGRRGHPVIFSAALYTELLAAPLDKGARAVVWAHAHDIAEVQTEEQGCLLNVNDAGALAKFRAKVS